MQVLLRRFSVGLIKFCEEVVRKQFLVFNNLGDLVAVSKPSRRSKTVTRVAYLVFARQKASYIQRARLADDPRVNHRLSVGN